MQNELDESIASMFPTDARYEARLVDGMVQVTKNGHPFMWMSMRVWNELRAKEKPDG